LLDRWAEHLSGLNQLQQDAVNEAGLLEGRKRARHVADIIRPRP